MTQLVDFNQMRHGTELLKRGFAKMQEGGVIMDVVTPEQAHIAEDAGAAKNRIEVDPIARSRHLGHMKKMEAMGDPPQTPPEFSPAPDAPGGGLSVRCLQD